MGVGFLNIRKSNFEPLQETGSFGDTSRPSSRQSEGETGRLAELENGFANIDVRCRALADKAQRYAYVERDGNGVLDVLDRDSSRVGGAPILTTAVLDEELSNVPQVDVIKIDVEGFEAEVLRGGEKLLRDKHPRLFLEMHGETINEKKRKVAEIVKLLVEFGYASITHVETGRQINPDNSALACRGHLYAATGQ